MRFGIYVERGEIELFARGFNDSVFMVRVFTTVSIEIDPFFIHRYASFCLILEVTERAKGRGIRVLIRFCIIT